MNKTIVVLRIINNVNVIFTSLFHYIFFCLDLLVVYRSYGGSCACVCLSLVGYIDGSCSSSTIFMPIPGLASACNNNHAQSRPQQAHNRLAIALYL